MEKKKATAHKKNLSFTSVHEIERKRMPFFLELFCSLEVKGEKGDKGLYE